MPFNHLSWERIDQININNQNNMKRDSRLKEIMPTISQCFYSITIIMESLDIG